MTSFVDGPSLHSTGTQIQAPPGTIRQQMITEVSSEFKLLKNIAEDMSCLKQSMKNIEGRLSSLEAGTIQQSVEPEDILPRSPFNSLEGFLEFDKMISNGKEAQLKMEMQRVGGNSLTEFVGRNLKKLIDDELGVGYSLWGKKNNKNFSETACWKALKYAAKSTKQLGANISEKMIEKAAMEWFRHCGGRLKAKQTN